MALPVRHVRLVSLILLVVWIPRGGALPVPTDLDTIYGNKCSFRLGPDIEDDEITASSYTQGYEPSKSRFNENMAGWRAEVNDVEQWIQVKLPTKMPVTGILTKGIPGEDIFVKEYKVEHSTDEEHWSCVMNMHSHPKEFEANTDDSTPKLNKFQPAVTTRFIRIKPLKWHGGIGMMLEIYGGGCKDCSEE